MAEFTGERVIPGQVDPDLWNEHRSRYMFASRLSRYKRVLDIGCGTGYGVADMARSAASVIGVDVAAQALEYAREHYSGPNISFIQASAAVLPIRDSSFDLIVSFELIEHLQNWQEMLAEAKRILAPGGQFIVSTPNKHFYAQFRHKSGPNPFHEHEFEFEDFKAELGKLFPHVSLFLQNHGPSIVFQPVEAGATAEVRVEGNPAAPEESNFFVAVCATTPQTGSPTFVHVPTSANVLRERSKHIVLLESELETKDRWLQKTKQQHKELVEQFRGLKKELEERNLWAEKLNTELDQARADIDRLNEELEQLARNYESKIASLEKEKDTQSQWAKETQQKLDEETKSLAHVVDVLHETEDTLKERTEWGFSLDARLNELQAKIAALQASKWVKIARAIGIGPEVLRK